MTLFISWRVRKNLENSSSWTVWKSFKITLVIHALTRRNQLKEFQQSYEEKYVKVKADINEHSRWHEPFIGIDYDKLMNLLYIDESDCEEESSDPVLSIWEIICLFLQPWFSLLSPEQFHSMCCQLNDAQKNFVSLIMNYVMKCKTALKTMRKTLNHST